MIEIQIGDCRFMPEANMILRNNESIRIERRATEVLEALVERRSEVVSQSDLHQLVWKGVNVSDHSVAIVISDLRKAFGDDWRNPRYIETIPKRGYRLIGEIDDPSNSVGEHKSAGERFFGRIQSRTFVIGLVPGAIGLLFFVAAFLQTTSLTETARKTNIAIVISEFCTSEASAEIEDLAYGLNRLISTSLAEDPKNRIVRSRTKEPSTNLFLSDRNHLRLNGSLLQSDHSLILVLELIEPRTQSIRWSSHYNLSEQSEAELVRRVADDVAKAT